MASWESETGATTCIGLEIPSFDISISVDAMKTDMTRWHNHYPVLPADVRNSLIGNSLIGMLQLHAQ